MECRVTFVAFRFVRIWTLGQEASTRTWWIAMITIRALPSVGLVVIGLY